MFELVDKTISQLEPLSPELLWILIVAFVIAFLLAFSVGANDVSNSFGTSVGSRVLTVTQACILATIFEAAGATLLGYSVCDTFRRKMYDVRLYDGAQRELMLGALACLIGSATWNLIATALKMPISGTHSIVGATIGFSVVLRGWDSIRWMDMLRIVASWFASPLLSGLISSLIYTLISKTIISKVDPLRHGLKALPLFYGVTIFINVASIVIDGPAVFGLNLLPWYAGLFISLVAATIAICCVAMIMVPRLRTDIMNELIARRSSAAGHFATSALRSPPTSAGYDNQTFKRDEDDEKQPAPKAQPPAKPKRELTLDAKQLQDSTDQQQQQQQQKRPTVAPKPAHLKRQLAQDQQSQEARLEEIDLGGPSNKPARDLEVGVGGSGPLMHSGERHEVARLFASLQILTACFASFAHGTNDVSNAVAPLIPIWNIYTEGLERVEMHTPIWILAFGSVGICTGLWAWGRAVMGTVSDGITKITPSKGFSIELGAAISVLLATKFGLPISTTHCKVGSLVIVGLVSEKFLAQDHLLSMSVVGGGGGGGGGGLDKQQLQKEQENEKSGGAVDWKMFGGIALTWIVTVPFAGLAAALVMLALKWVAL